MNIKNAINYGCDVLKKNNIKSYSLDSEILISKAINKKREFIILNLNQGLSQKNFSNFKKLIDQRSKGKPIAYLIKKKEFWKNTFSVNEKVLIPRPDTEIIVKSVLDLTKNKTKLNILEIGIGTGCILLSILNEKKGFYGTGIDISKECVDLSKLNASKLGLSNKVNLFKSDVDNFINGKYDLIISNPPYIKKLDLKYLEKDVRNFEPKIALDGGLEGLSEIRKIIKKTSELIKKNGKFFLEIAFDQKIQVKKMLTKNGFYINDVLKDLGNNDRCIISTKL